ncbi:hypothetical protein OEA41_007487 [Lepraria neglecta]|uniref:Uncharacterized protein n=1 Tax=Lepraria neglecta TaxID=209136 RepID=A0AAD9ZFK6_9LECA|nr:hypothetical protein OEA41_007487 [Lepraria neglecta]
MDAREKMSSKPAIRLEKSSVHWKYKLDDETVAQFDASNEIKTRWSYDGRDEEDGLESYKMAVQLSGLTAQTGTPIKMKES